MHYFCGYILQNSMNTLVNLCNRHVLLPIKMKYVTFVPNFRIFFSSQNQCKEIGLPCPRDQLHFKVGHTYMKRQNGKSPSLLLYCTG